MHIPSLEEMIIQPANEAPGSRFQMSILAGIGQALQNSPIPGFLLDFASNDVSPVGRSFLRETSTPFASGGMRQVIPAMAKVMDWTQFYQASQVQEQAQRRLIVPARHFSTSPGGSWSEHQARNFLQQESIPVIPAQLTTGVEQAVSAAREIGFPVALKIASPDIVHKSDIGGVKLGLQNEEEVRDAFAQVMKRANAVTPAPHIEGVLVSPMRLGGVELLVGVTSDDTWGQVLAVGMSGIWVEVLKDTCLRVLPVSRGDVQAMLAELQGAALLRGARGSKPADLDALVEVIYRVTQLAQSLKADLESLEINPLRVDGSQIEALDAVITWQEEQTAARSDR